MSPSPGLRLGILLLGLISPGAVAAAADYRVTVDPGLGRLEVEACFSPALPASLAPADARAAAYLERPRRLTGGRERPLALDRAPDGARLPLGGVGCVRYGVDLDGAVSAGGWYGQRLALRVEGARLLSPHLFLWAPDGGLDGATIRFDLPAGMSVSVPWEPAPLDRDAYLLGSRPLTWDARIAVGRLMRSTIRLPGLVLESAVLQGAPPVSGKDIEHWLRRSGGALTAIDSAGSWDPIEHLQVLVVPVGRSDEPVPWAEVMRGGGDAVHLYIDQTRPLAGFLADWTLVHELSHLLHPYLGGDGRWLYEGLASYYQNVLRARAGLLDPREAWRRLHAAFGRGRAGTKPGQSLARASERMPVERGFMRVYWSGAAVALLSDLALREASGGRESLDTALIELRRRHGPFDRAWSADELLETLDAVTGTRILTDLSARWLVSDRFPDLAGAYPTLGLIPRGDSDLRFADDPAAIRLRAGIMGRD
jgi:hypothetical protein